MSEVPGSAPSRKTTTRSGRGVYTLMLYTPAIMKPLKPLRETGSESPDQMKLGAQLFDRAWTAGSRVRPMARRPPGPSNRLTKINRSVKRHVFVSKTESGRPNSRCPRANRKPQESSVVTGNGGSRGRATSLSMASVDPCANDGASRSRKLGNIAPASGIASRCQRAWVAFLVTFLSEHSGPLHDILLPSTDKSPKQRSGEMQGPWRLRGRGRSVGRLGRTVK